MIDVYWFKERAEPRALVDELRGGPALRFLARYRCLRLIEAPPGSKVDIGGGICYVPMRTGICEDDIRWFASLRTPGRSMIVDMHFPIDRPEDTWALTDSGKRDPELDDLMQRDLANPDRRAALVSQLEEADVVLVPHRQWLQLAGDYNSRVVLAPDVKNAYSAVRFIQAFARAVWLCKEGRAAAEEWRPMRLRPSWLRQVVAEATVPFLLHMMRRFLREDAP